MAIFSTNSTAETNTADESVDDLGVNLALTNIPADIKNLLIKVAGDIPAGQQGDSTRPRYALLKGKIAAYAGFYLDGSTTPVLKYDDTTNSGTDPFYIASATFTVTAAGVNNNKITLKVKVKTVDKTIAEYTVKTNDTTATVAQGLTNLINIPKLRHGFYASVSGSAITIRATDIVGGDASDLTLSFTKTGTANGTVTTQFASSISKTNQINRSIDKLTFYIMFRAPFKNAAYNTFYGDPLVNIATSWSYAANELRVAHGLKRLNSAGEQVLKVGTEWKQVNDANQELDGYTTENAYEFLGIDVKSADYFSDSKSTYTNQHSLDLPSVERTKLFTHVDATQPKAGYNKIPAYFFIVAIRQENPYLAGFWLAAKKDTYYSRGAHFPANLGAKYKNRKFIRFTTALGTAVVAGQTIKKDAGTGNHYVEVATVKYNLQLAAGEQLTSVVDAATGTSDDYIYESLTLEGATVVKEGTRYLAEFNPMVDVVLDNNSAITVGMGLDIGNAFSGLYKIEFTIAATGNFRLYYWDKVSAELSYSTLTASQLKIALNSVLFPPHLESLGGDVKTKIKDLVTVTGPVTQGTIKTYTVKINRAMQAPYSHPIYSAIDDLSQVNSNVTFNPAADKDRWKVNTDVEKDSWYYFLKAMNYGFSNEPKANGVYDKDFWLKQNSISAADQTLIKNLTRFALGVSRGRSYALYTANKDLLKKVEFKSFVQNMRGIYNEIFIPRYYNKRRPIEDGTTRSNGDHVIESGVMDLLPDIHAPNQAELHIMASMVFNAGSISSSRATAFINAIKGHSQKSMGALVEMLIKPRRESAYQFTHNLTMIKNIYRGVID